MRPARTGSTSFPMSLSVQETEASCRRVPQFLIPESALITLMKRTPRGGRPSKGQRDLLVTRPAASLGQIVRDSADECGMTVSDYVAGVLARAHGMPELAPAVATPTQHQEELPLKTA